MQEPLMILLTGRPGSGKSIAAASFPRPILFFDTDMKPEVIRRFYKVQEDDPSVKIIQYAPHEKDLFRLKNDVEKLEGQTKYKTVVFDSVTTLGRMALRAHILMTGSEALKDRSRQGAGFVNPEMNDYKFESTVFSEILGALKSNLRKLNCHIIFIAHLIETETRNPMANVKAGEERIIKYRGLVTGASKLQAEIPLHFSEEWSTITMDESYRIVTRQLGDTPARTTLSLPQIIDITKPKSLFGELVRLLEPSGIALLGSDQVNQANK